ncbi:hypothetical protein BFP72_11110 [Reichenbachiella sp. 5M10]|uniref:ABC transporter ATP-binding protein n=1 Tax=Reichenbachiella sp. 5M10 TaxID=1889772 RepID=UPI000C15CDC0|nr:ATP-binding cassette domain-containing protein [Reichenbachiella sp. 5M10]PIB35901.1 hypothetical protein BFP72_11110 [Reichenbachiella sp. 5M10]
MEVILDKISKRFSNKEWIFKDIEEHFLPGDRIAITGSNGSGKSTLLKTIGGMTLPSHGEIIYRSDQGTLDQDHWIDHLVFSSPYLELIEDFSLLEMLTFHFQFKTMREDLSINQMIQTMYFQKQENKLIKNFSSGMKQRLKLGLCFFTKADLLLLDEPTANLDQTGIDWYLTQIQQLPSECTLLIASNQSHEYSMCTRTIEMNP